MTVPPPGESVAAGGASGRSTVGGARPVGPLAVVLSDRYLIEALKPRGLSIGQDTLLSRPVAFLPLAAPSATSQTAAASRQLRQALRRAAAVRAPGVATLLDGALLEDRLLLVYLPATATLADALRRTPPLDQAGAVAALLPVADAVAAVRAAGLAPGPLDAEYLPVDDHGAVYVLPVPTPESPGVADPVGPAPASLAAGTSAAPGSSTGVEADGEADARADEAALRHLALQLLGNPPAPPATGPLAPLFGDGGRSIGSLRAASLDAPSEPPSSSRDVPSTRPGGESGGPLRDHAPMPSDAGVAASAANRAGDRRDRPAASSATSWGTSWAVTVLLALLAAAVVLGIGLLVT